MRVIQVNIDHTVEEILPYKVKCANRCEFAHLIAVRRFKGTHSICFTPEGGHIYFTDTPTRQILQYPYGEEIDVNQQRLFACVDKPGLPDGSIVDKAVC
jgi:sugar lactone lactonase YvrE